MKAKRIPIRMCIGCHQRREKKGLIRIVKTLQGNIEVDPTGKKSGRGAYVCPQVECVQALCRKDLSSAFRFEIEEAEFIALKDMLLGYLKNPREGGSQ
ncbi:MAG: YlxR family protein [Candidatus Atribacteria bacterium]|nr:YlxR family protein [Candidatus Atribacteria bacterium]